MVTSKATTSLRMGRGEGERLPIINVVVPALLLPGWLQMRLPAKLWPMLVPASVHLGDLLWPCGFALGDQAS